MSQVENPYEPPKAELAQETSGKARSPFLAIAAGIGIDIGGSIIASLLISIIYAALLGLSGMSANDIATTIASGEMRESWPHALMLAFGLGFSIFGGYVCARMVKRSEYHFGAIQGGLLGAFGLFMGSTQYSQAVHLGLIFATFAAVLAGVHLGSLRNLQKSA